jgi:hypothetical protein
MKFKNNVFVNLSEAMKSRYGSEVRNKLKGRILDSPWRFLPDCSNLTVEVGLPSPIFFHYGILKRTGTKINLEPWVNSSMNRYMEHQIRRLQRCKTSRRYVLYWHICKLILKRSNVFRVAAINHVFPNWHRKYPIGFIIGVNRKVSQLVNEQKVNMDYKRVYIPKDDKRWRPLGVPKPEWRLLLHQWNNFITYFVKDKLKNQHGYIPGKGTLSAWQQIMREKVMEKPFVYEWDFVSFFNTLSLSRLRRIYSEWGVPEIVIDYIDAVNRSLIKLPDSDKQEIDETREKSRSALGGKSAYYLATTSTLWEDYKYKKLLEQTEPKGFEFEDYFFLQELEFPHRFHDWLFEDYEFPTISGVPQGGAISPIQGNMIMNDWITQSNTCNKIAYADDSIGYSDKYFTCTVPTGTGIEINKKKSGWIRYRNKTIKPLKFLGLCYDGKNLWADTRKGSKLKITGAIWEMLHQLDLIRYDLSCSLEEAIQKLTKYDSVGFYGNSQDRGNWEKWFCSKIAGFLQSRFYLNDWFNPQIEQCFEFKYQKKSWADTKNAEIPKMVTGGKDKTIGLSKTVHKYPLTVFNSSSFACWSLCNIFRSNQKRRPRKELGIFIKRGFRRPKIASMINSYMKNK